MWSFGRWSAVSFVALGLAACGGGGGRGGDAVTGILDTAHYAAVSGDVMASVVASAGLGEAADVVGTTDASAIPALPSRPAGGAWTQALDLARATLRSPLSVRPQEVVNEEEACPGGGRLLITYTYQNTGTLTPGDTADVVADHCVREVGGPVVTGSFRLTVQWFVESSSRVAIALTMDFNAYGSVEERVSGRADFSDELTMTSERLAVAFRGTQVITPTDTLVWDHRLAYLYTSSVNELSVTGRATVDGDTYALSQTQPFAIDAVSGFPVGGVMRITDADGAHVDVTATATRFTYTYYAAGASTPTAGPVDGPLYTDL